MYAGLSRLSPQTAAAALHPMSLAGGSPMLAPHGRGGFARHRLTSLPSFDVWLRQNKVGGRR